jgi:hypothetical protein
MNTLARLLPIVYLIGAATSSTMAQAQPMVYDANGTAVATPAGQANGFLSAYLSIDASVVMVHFAQGKGSSNTMQWMGGDSGALYFRSSDCSGPALLTTGGAIGTVPAALLAEKKHAWLHVADSTEGLGIVTVNSYVRGHKQCQQIHIDIEAWKAKPAIDLDMMFTPPFSIR